MYTVNRDRRSNITDALTRTLLISALLVRDWPPPADVVMETLFWGSHSFSLSHNAALGC